MSRITRSGSARLNASRRHPIIEHLGPIALLRKSEADHLSNRVFVLDDRDEARGCEHRF